MFRVVCVNARIQEFVNKTVRESIKTDRANRCARGEDYASHSSTKRSRTCETRDDPHHSRGRVLALSNTGEHHYNIVDLDTV